MNSKTRSITLSAVLIALNVMFLYLAAIMPSGRMGFIALSSLLVIAGVVELGLGSAVLVFIGAAVISALILPEKTAVIVYALFFGYYPIIKSLAERHRSKVVMWLLKLAVFNTAFSVIWFLFSKILFDTTYLELSLFVIYPAVNLVFIIFDIGLTRLIGFYVVRISKNIKKNNR